MYQRSILTLQVVGNLVVDQLSQFHLHLSAVLAAVRRDVATGVQPIEPTGQYTKTATAQPAIFTR